MKSIIILIFDYVIKNKNPFAFIYDWEICLVYVFPTLCIISIFKDLHTYVYHKCSSRLFNIIINKIIHTVCMFCYCYIRPGNVSQLRV